MAYSEQSLNKKKIKKIQSQDNSWKKQKHFNP